MTTLTEPPDVDHHVVVDCSTGETGFVPLTAEEARSRAAEGAEWVRGREQEAADAERLRGLAAEHADPLVQALARRAGIL